MAGWCDIAQGPHTCEKEKLHVTGSDCSFPASPLTTALENEFKLVRCAFDKVLTVLPASVVLVI